MKPIVLLVVLLCSMTGCSSSDPEDPNLEAWVREVEVLEPQYLGDREFEELGVFEERERITGLDEESAIGQARYRLKRRAAKVDADAIVITACGRNVKPSEQDYLLDKDPAVVCRGVAIRWTN